MPNIKKRLNEIVEDIEKNIKNKDDLEYIKSQIYNISLLFLDELDKVVETHLGRLNVLLEREKRLTRRVENMEIVVKSLERDMRMSENISEDNDFEILCPYCNTEFVEDFSNGFKHEVRCPECDNIIELDWNENGGCSCEHEFDEECQEDDEEENNENEDDM